MKCPKCGKPGGVPMAFTVAPCDACYRPSGEASGVVPAVERANPSRVLQHMRELWLKEIGGKL